MVRTIVLDANALVSGVLARHPAAPPFRVLQAVRADEWIILLSAAVVAEYRDVLLRPRVAARHRLRRDVIDSMLTRLMECGLVIDPSPSPFVAPDPDDQIFWDLLESEPDAIFVTGDQALLTSTVFPGRITSPRLFVEQHLP